MPDVDEEGLTPAQFTRYFIVIALVIILVIVIIWITFPKLSSYDPSIATMKDGSTYIIGVHVQRHPPKV